MRLKEFSRFLTTARLSIKFIRFNIINPTNPLFCQYLQKLSCFSELQSAAQLAARHQSEQVPFLFGFVGLRCLLAQLSVLRKLLPKGMLDWLDVLVGDGGLGMEVGVGPGGDADAGVGLVEKRRGLLLGEGLKGDRNGWLIECGVRGGFGL